MSKYSIGVDFGTSSVRALLVNLTTGEECGTAVWNYAHGVDGVLVDPKNVHLARQHPKDYIDGLLYCLKQVVAQARKNIRRFSAEDVIGIGVDTTGSTPIPVDVDGVPLAFHSAFKSNPNAMAWLWKDHTGHEEAAEITEKIKKSGLPYLNQCGGTYSSEWYWSKILHCLRTDPKVYRAAYSWVEFCDWVPAYLTGNLAPTQIKRGVCAAGHKCLYSEEWNGWPAKKFLASLDGRLTSVLNTLAPAYPAGEPMGGLHSKIAQQAGLAPGTAVSVGAFDAHLGAVGSGVGPGKIVKIIGTSTCDVTVAPLSRKKPLVPGICGIVKDSVLPGYWGLEAGQSAVGDIFNWFVSHSNPLNGNGKKSLNHSGKLLKALSESAAKLSPGENGLVALDWHNGNRTVLVDPQLTGAVIGQTLHTTPAEQFRALIEATGYGARMIIERIEEHGVKIKEVIACGGIAEKNPLLVQIYADIFNRSIRIAQSAQTCALGSAIAGAVAAGKQKGGYNHFEEAIKALVRYKKEVYRPNRAAVKVYDDLFGLYKQVHDHFGVQDQKLYPVMKKLLKIKAEAQR